MSYQVLNNELNEINNSFEPKIELKNSNECIICLEDLNLPQNNTTLRCNHIYHTMCIHNWLRENNSCPICRHVVSNNYCAYYIKCPFLPFLKCKCEIIINNDNITINLNNKDHHKHIFYYRRLKFIYSIANIVILEYRTTNNKLTKFCYKFNSKNNALHFFYNLKTKLSTLE